MNNLDEQLKRIQTNEIALMTSLTIVSLTMAAVRLYKDYLTKAALRCGGIPDKEKAICMLHAKVYAKKAQLQSLTGAVGKCTKVKNPEACKVKMVTKIKQLNREIENLSNRVKELKGRKYNK